MKKGEDPKQASKQVKEIPNVGWGNRADIVCQVSLSREAVLQMQQTNTWTFRKLWHQQIFQICMCHGWIWILLNLLWELKDWAVKAMGQQRRLRRSSKQRLTASMAYMQSAETIDPMVWSASFVLPASARLFYLVLLGQFLLRRPPMNHVHVGSPRGEQPRLCLVAHYVRLILCEHTHLVWRKYKEAEVLIMYHVFLYPNHPEVSMQQTESPWGVTPETRPGLWLPPSITP